MALEQRETGPPIRESEIPDGVESATLDIMLDARRTKQVELMAAKDGTTVNRIVDEAVAEQFKRVAKKQEGIGDEFFGWVNDR